MKIPNRIGMRPLFMHSSIIFPLFDLIAVAFVWSSKELYRRAVERLHKRIWKMFQRNALNNIKFHTQLLSTSNTEKRRRCTEEMVIIILVFRKRHKKTAHNGYKKNYCHFSRMMKPIHSIWVCRKPEELIFCPSFFHSHSGCYFRHRKFLENKIYFCLTDAQVSPSAVPRSSST